MKIAILSAALTIAFVPAALAQPYGYGPGDATFEAKDVYTGDLRAADPAARDEAAWRIDQAGATVCQPYPDAHLFIDVNDYRACRADAFEGGMAEFEHRAVRGQRRGHVTTREYPEPPEPDDDDGE